MNAAETAAALPSPEEALFTYARFTRRNRGFISDRAQAGLAEVVVLVAGCGSTGGAAVEPLTRLGVQRFLLADVGCYELDNLNRQSAFIDEVGRHKAEVCAGRVRAINPRATTQIRTEGITGDNVDDLVSSCDVVIDGVDVTERSGWVAKFALHEAAARLGRPVVSGYDMAGTQYVRFYGYRPGDAAFAGAITGADLARRSTWELLSRIVPLRFVPVEMLELARSRVRTGEEGLPQVVYASLAFGAIAARILVSLLEGQRIRTHIVVNVDSAVRCRRAGLSAVARKPVVALLALRDLAAGGSRIRHG